MNTKQIQTNKDKPFFCYIANNAPHSPLNLPKKYLDNYKDVEGINDQTKRFFGMISNIDDNFKNLEERLNTLELTENTILIFI